MQEMVILGDRNANEGRSASPGVNFERVTIFVMPNAFCY
ncbi:hypothetical protein AVDCRST_MAG84-3537 [uncultured Microcoleus sp.]|uniref:Uncharacterized protein n=1 Tax=uncultured Microcoleus sp. TaxID=259945 RepID=A0A6J4MN32_9CYAN|nr:hypothetical protein AVDCRST_MAG84-3537 [uncultured Microcoleus sp.]